MLNDLYNSIQENCDNNWINNWMGRSTSIVILSIQH